MKLYILTLIVRGVDNVHTFSEEDFSMKKGLEISIFLTTDGLKGLQVKMFVPVDVSMDFTINIFTYYKMINLKIFG